MKEKLKAAAASGSLHTATFHVCEVKKVQSVPNLRVIHQSLALFGLRHQQQTSADYPRQSPATQTAIAIGHQTIRFMHNTRVQNKNNKVK